MLLYFARYDKGWATFFEMFLNKELAYGDWFDHVLSWWNLNHHQNVLIVTYEELQDNVTSVIARIARFCNVSNTTRAFAEKVGRLSSFDHMKTDPNANRDEIGRFDSTISPYMRKGKVGGWRNVFTVKQNKIMDELLQKRMSGTRLEVQFV